ncbi:MAG: hypothetical protein ACTFAL_03725 [Candidatus Electronema sp. V4]|uniref:hypothetical protein n=1 Tax=Candidatus Electronema sp. V4 TaxID=3454756 RepID=UPI0040554679
MPDSLKHLREGRALEILLAENLHVFILSLPVARAMAVGRVPGVLLPPELLARMEQAAELPGLEMDFPLQGTWTFCQREAGRMEERPLQPTLKRGAVRIRAFSHRLMFDSC